MNEPDAINLRLMEVGDTEVQQLALFDLMALHPSLRGFLLAPSAELRVTWGASADRAAVMSLVAGHEGPESAELAALWWDQDPGAWVIIKDRTAPASSSLRAAMALTALPEPGGPLDVDPAVVAARIRLGRHPPVRPGERVTYVRWWLDAEKYQKPSPAQSLLAVQLTRHYLTTPGLAVSFVPTADPDTWFGPMIYTDQNPMPEADFALGGHRYSVFGHDWRAVPPARWLALMSERETAREPVPVLPERPGEVALLALSRQESAAVPAGAKPAPGDSSGRRPRTGGSFGCAARSPAGGGDNLASLPPGRKGLPGVTSDLFGSGAVARSSRPGPRPAVQHLPAAPVCRAASDHRHPVGTGAARLRLRPPLAGTSAAQRPSGTSSSRSGAGRPVGRWRRTAGRPRRARSGRP
jgi:hypothetical protein